MASQADRTERDPGGFQDGEESEVVCRPLLLSLLLLTLVDLGDPGASLFTSLHLISPLYDGPWS